MREDFLVMPRPSVSLSGLTTRVAAVGLLGLGLVAGCGTSHAKSATSAAIGAGVTTTTPSTTTLAPATTLAPTTTPAPTTSTTVARPAQSVPPATTTTTAPPAATLTYSEADNGRSVTVHRGDHLVVVLHSTYWSFDPISGAVTADGSPTVAPQLQGCVPGGGCGTVTARFTAVAAGTATIHAHRDSCGEAMRCTGTQGDWRLNVTVSA